MRVKRAALFSSHLQYTIYRINIDQNHNIAVKTESYRAVWGSVLRMLEACFADTWWETVGEDSWLHCAVCVIAAAGAKSVRLCSG